MVRAIDAAKLTFWLKRRGRAQRWLASKLRIGETDFSHMVHGRRLVPDGVVDRAAALLQVAADDITVDTVPTATGAAPGEGR